MQTRPPPPPHTHTHSRQLLRSTPSQSRAPLHVALRRRSALLHCVVSPCPLFVLMPRFASPVSPLQGGLCHWVKPCVLVLSRNSKRAEDPSGGGEGSRRKSVVRKIANRLSKLTNMRGMGTAEDSERCVYAPLSFFVWTLVQLGGGGGYLGRAGWSPACAQCVSVLLAPCCFLPCCFLCRWAAVWSCWRWVAARPSRQAAVGLVTTRRAGPASWTWVSRRWPTLCTKRLLWCVCL
jgi:hypothetical protein